MKGDTETITKWLKKKDLEGGRDSQGMEKGDNYNCPKERSSVKMFKLERYFPVVSTKQDSSKHLD